MKNIILKIEKLLGNMKFAVVLVLVFTIAMIYGTFQESYHGTDFAARKVYKSYFFMILQALVFLSVAMAALQRLPLKKRLYGFYTIHAGIIILILGSFITYHAGIDGHLTLTQNNPSRNIIVPEDVISIKDLGNNKEFTYKLPFTASEVDLDIDFKGLKIKKYLPFSSNNLEWFETSPFYKERFHSSLHHSSKYLLTNAFTSEEFLLSLHPEAKEFEASMQLGPLSIHYLPSKLADCFDKNSPSGLILWNENELVCQTLEELNITPKKTNSGKRLVIFNQGQQTLIFLPDQSPWPIQGEIENLNFNTNSNFRIFNKSIFEKRPTLFAFGKKVSFFEDGQWVVKSVELKGSVDLPWMGATLKLLDHQSQKYPAFIPFYTKPVQDGGKVVVGNQKAILIEHAGKKYWIKSDETKSMPIRLLVDGNQFKIGLDKNTHKLPFELTLNRFKMDNDPGTRSPASYESFVTLFTENGPTKHHIYMNNPLKYSKLTFYQSSYFQDRNKNYGSVLSVNYDPGRPWKYLGSILLVFGSIWHYFIRREKVKKKKS